MARAAPGLNNRTFPKTIKPDATRGPERPPPVIDMASDRRHPSVQSPAAGPPSRYVPPIGDRIEGRHPQLTLRQLLVTLESTSWTIADLDYKAKQGCDVQEERQECLDTIRGVCGELATLAVRLEAEVDRGWKRPIGDLK